MDTENTNQNPELPKKTPTKDKDIQQQLFGYEVGLRINAAKEKVKALLPKRNRDGDSKKGSSVGEKLEEKRNQLYKEKFDKESANLMQLFPETDQPGLSEDSVLEANGIKATMALTDQGKQITITGPNDHRFKSFYRRFYRLKIDNEGNLNLEKGFIDDLFDEELKRPYRGNEGGPQPVDSWGNYQQAAELMKQLTEAQTTASETSGDKSEKKTLLSEAIAEANSAIGNGHLSHESGTNYKNFLDPEDRWGQKFPEKTDGTYRKWNTDLLVDQTSNLKKMFDKASFFAKDGVIPTSLKENPQTKKKVYLATEFSENESGDDSMTQAVIAFGPDCYSYVIDKGKITAIHKSGTPFADLSDGNLGTNLLQGTSKQVDVRQALDWFKAAGTSDMGVFEPKEPTYYIEKDEDTGKDRVKITKAGFGILDKHAGENQALKKAVQSLRDNAAYNENALNAPDQTPKTS